MPYSQIYYHIVWATKDRYPFLTPEIESVLYPVIASKCSEKRVLACAANGTPDHMHLVVSAPPSIAPSDLVKFLKGATSFVISAEFKLPFAWQRGYGIFSLGQDGLDSVVQYVNRQKQHHRDGTIIEEYESVPDRKGKPYILT